MNHYVPNFELEYESYSTPPTSGGFIKPHKKPSMAVEEDIMELLWQDGQVVLQSQNHRPLSNKIGCGVGVGADETTTSIEPQSEIQSQAETTPRLFIQEDEMATWLHLPVDDTSLGADLYANLLHAPPPPPPSARLSALPPVTKAAPRPPTPPLRRAEMDPGPTRLPNFPQFSSMKTRLESGSMNFNIAAQEFTIVDSNETPMVGPVSRVSNVEDSSARIPEGRRNADCGSAAVAGTSSPTARQLTATCERTVTSSPGVSGASYGANVEPLKKLQRMAPATEDRKRKGIDTDDIDYHTFSEDVDFESADAKKQARGSTSTKRSRAAEVHNLSERKRRDRINERMRALQELIPRCNKSDKASMLDEAIEYLKSLQLQVQMMSMGCGMVPMVFPGYQQFMPAMGMGIGMGMGMGMGMDMGMNRPMVPFPSVLAGSALPSSTTGAHLGPTLPIPAFRMPLYDPSRNEAMNQSDAMVNNSLVPQNSIQTQMPNFADSYQQFLGVQLMQNQALLQPSKSKPSSSREAGNQDNNQNG